MTNVTPIGVIGPPVGRIFLPYLDQPGNVDIVFMPTGSGSGGASFTRTVVVNPDGSFTFPFGGYPLRPYDLCFKRGGFLNKKVHVDLTDDATAIDVTLEPGDINGDNSVDPTDFGLFVGDYNSARGDLNYDPCADFNNDGSIDATDFGLLIGSYGDVGDPCP